MAFIALVFNKDFEGHKSGKQEVVELSLGRRYIELGVAVPLSVHLDKRAAEKAKAAKADEAKKAELLKKKEEAEIEKADSKTAKRRSKEVKK